MFAPPTWSRLLRAFARDFSTPSAALFEQLATGWVLCPGRHTLTRLWSVIPDAVRHPYGAYARWVRVGHWSMARLWQGLLEQVVGHWVPTGPLTVLLDDTLFHKSGRHVNGAGLFRDAVRSTASQTVIALGLNVVVLALRVQPPWGGEPLALPIGVALHRKGGPTLIALAVGLMQQLATWLPDREFCLVADGAYASLVGADLPRTTVVSRLRRDAALYALPPPRRPGQLGRPRKKGVRLPTPPALAARARRWQRATVPMRSRVRERELWARTLLWYEAARDRPLQLVIVRDPTGVEPDDFFITTDRRATPAQVASAYADRWPIEVTNRDVKQVLGAEDPQSWVGDGPERVVALGCWLTSAVWHWFLLVGHEHQAWPDRPWYPAKRTPSFLDAVATLRRDQWTAYLFGTSRARELTPENARALLTVLAEAA